MSTALSDGSGSAAGSMRVTASLMVHLHPGTPMRVTLHPGQDRVVLALGGSRDPATVDLFVQRAELLALRDALTAAVTDLDAAQHAITQYATSTHHGAAGPADQASLSGEASTPAA